MKKQIIKFPSFKKYKKDEFFMGYTSALKETLDQLDYKKIKIISDIIFKIIKNKKQIFVAGNGGSSAIANHFLCDFNKGIKESSKKKLKPKIISLSSSVESITAISNDINFNEIFTYQVENYSTKDDLILLFSCSGKSKNIINLLNYSLKNKIKVIYITGFLSKKIVKKNMIHLNLNCKNYGITEDVFSSLMHLVSQYIRFKYSKKEIL
jgi:D-sedoheptulose 7-phosphate isomerase